MHFHIVTSLTKYFILVFHQRKKKKKNPFILKYIFTQTIKERKRYSPLRSINIGWYSPFEIYKWFLAMEYCIGEVMMWEGIYLYVWDNYRKPTWGLARFHFAYPWFKTLHFAHLRLLLLAFRNPHLHLPLEKHIFRQKQV